MSEKFPFLFERRFFIRAYDYWYGYTKAQIELMSIDQPITVYKKEKGGASGTKHTRAEMQKIAADWEKKHGKAGKVEGKVDLNEFIAGGTTADKGK